MTKANTKKKIAKGEISKEEVESGKRVSGEPDSNLSAVGAGGVGGAAAGALIGTAVGGPVGAAIGAAAGAVAGAAVADQIQDELDPKLEEVYWEENYKTRPYYKAGDKFDAYLPAYRFGWESAVRGDYSGRDFPDLEPDLRTEWVKKDFPEDWETSRERVRDAFDRIRSRIKNVIE